MQEQEKYTSLSDNPMKINYAFYTAVLMGLLGFQPLQAQGNREDVERVKQILTFGDWKDAGKELGIDTRNLPTQVKNFFYNNKGQLVRVLEGDVRLGDNPETILNVEKLGDVQPSAYTHYTYDGQGRLTSVCENRYETTNGWFFTWQANDTLTVCKYNDNGQLAEKTEKDISSQYTWKGQHCVTEKRRKKDNGELIAATYYSDFISETANAPRKAIEVTSKEAFYLELNYNEQQQLIDCTRYQLTHPVKDDNGNIFDGQKGTPCVQKTYTYQNGQLQQQTTRIWDNSTRKFTDSEKTVTSFNPQRGGYETTTYACHNGEWTVTAAPEVAQTATYDWKTAAGTLQVNAAGPRPNSAVLSFNIPEGTDRNTRWQVFRNGVMIGYAGMLDNHWEYRDPEVANGTYDYYVMADTTDTPGCKPVSNIVTYRFTCQHKAVDNVQIVESGTTKLTDEAGNSRKAYLYGLAWKAPETTQTVLGYNVYLNPGNNLQGATPHNSKLLTSPYYNLIVDHEGPVQQQIVVESIYATGIVQSAPLTITLEPNAENCSSQFHNIRKVTTYGDAMGELSETQPSKEDVNYYDDNQRLVMTVSYGFLMGDDPSTPETEKAGDLIPTQYTLYDYDQKGRLVQKRNREYGVFSGYDKAWADDFETVATFAYDSENGNLVKETASGKTHEYQWKGDSLITETISTARDHTPLAHITYSRFSTAGRNLPQYALSISKSPNYQNYNRIYEFEYDNCGRRVEKRTYKHGNHVEKDENGVIVNADKGILNERLVWEYEGDRLKQYTKYTYSSSLQKTVPYSKKVYTATATGLREDSYTYTNIGTTNAWTVSSIHKETTRNTYFGQTAPGELTLTEVEGETNTLLLSCKQPAHTYRQDVVFDVYRNGKIIGQAQPNAEGQLTYKDACVPNGTWHYFIKARSAYEAIDFCTTTIVEKVLDTALPAVTAVTFPVNGCKPNGDYQLVAQWEAPETGLKVIGYNVFSDIRSFTKNPSPINGVDALPADTRSYEFSWMSHVNPNKTICIETVYNIGKAKSENIPVTLSKVPVGICTPENNPHIAVKDNLLLIDIPYLRLDLYAANGACIGKYSQKSTISLEACPAGVYVLRLTTAQGTETLKVIKK